MEDNKYTPEEFTCLPRDELCRILAEELHKPTTEIDDALVRKLMAELHSKGADPSFVDDAAVENSERIAKWHNLPRSTGIKAG